MSHVSHLRVCVCVSLLMCVACLLMTSSVCVCVTVFIRPTILRHTLSASLCGLVVPTVTQYVNSLLYSVGRTDCVRRCNMTMI